MCTADVLMLWVFFVFCTQMLQHIVMRRYLTDALNVLSTDTQPELKLCFLSLRELHCMPVLVFTGGAAVKAGVQEGDRIIKVLLLIYHRCRIGVICFFLFLASLMILFSICLHVSGERLAGVLHVPSGGGKAHQM